MPFTEGQLNPSFRHGHTSRKKGRVFLSPTYRSWKSMIERCTKKNHPHFHRYGGRDIKVCDRWLDFCNFLFDMGERPIDKTLDRKDNDGNYELKNCRWATTEDQSKNTSSSQKTHCPHGHPYSGDNLSYYPSGGRRCKACNRIKAQAKRDQLKGLS